MRNPQNAVNSKVDSSSFVSALISGIAMARTIGLSEAIRSVIFHSFGSVNDCFHFSISWIIVFVFLIVYCDCYAFIER